MTTLTFEHTTYTVKGGLGSATTFPLFQMEGETESKFLYRIYGWADRWCPIAKDADIPKKGIVANVWSNYLEIRTLSDDDLYEEVYYMSSNETCRSHEMEGVYARTWHSLLRLEVERRRKTSG